MTNLKLSEHFGEPVIISSGYRCNQLILEHDSKGSYWIHVSCRRNRKANRHQVFYDLKK